MEKAEDRGGQMAAHPRHPEGQEDSSVRMNFLLYFFVLIEASLPKSKVDGS